MKDVRPVETASEHATTDLPLQAQLMGSLALVFILSAIAGLIGYATFDSSSLEASMRAKSTMYASNLTSQLFGAVATMDPVLAEEALAPLKTDRNVYGVAVYGPGVEVARPPGRERASSTRTGTPASATSIAAISPARPPPTTVTSVAGDVMGCSFDGSVSLTHKRAGTSGWFRASCGCGSSRRPAGPAR